MTNSYVKYTGNGVTRIFSVPFPFLKREYVQANIYDGTFFQPVDPATIEWVSDSAIKLPTAPESGTIVLIKRDTDRNAPVTDFHDGSTLIEEDLDLQVTQLLHISQEAFDALDGQTAESAFISSVNAERSAAQAAACRDQACEAAQNAQDLVDNAITSIESAAQNARTTVSNEGNTQVNRVQQEGMAQVGQAAQRAEQARQSAQTALDAANRAEAVVGLGPATRTQLGLVKVGDGISVTADGTISVKMPTVVTTPAVVFPAQVGIGYAYDASFTAESSVMDQTIAYFEVTFDADALIRVPAANNTATASFVPSGRGGTTGSMSVVAVDTLENVSLIATVTFLKSEVVKASPGVIAPAQGAANVSMTPTITIENARISGMPAEARDTEIQIATDSGFEHIVAGHSAGSGYVVVYSPPQLASHTTYYVRARHQFVFYGWSAWGAVTAFTTIEAKVHAPTILSPKNNSTGITPVPDLLFTPFSFQGTDDIPVGTMLQVALDPQFTDIIHLYNGPYLTGYSSGVVLPMLTTLYVRVAHIGEVWGRSAWSQVVAFTTLFASVSKPVVSSPVHNAESVGLSPAIVAASVAAGQELTGKQAQVATDAEFASLAWDSGQQPYSETTTVGVTLAKTTPYYARVRAFGSLTGASAWSEAVAFTTASLAVNETVKLTDSTSETWTVPETGTYLITIVGNGGGGCSSSRSSGAGEVNGYGGAGGLAESRVHLEKGDKCTFVWGAAGVNTFWGGSGPGAYWYGVAGGTTSFTLPDGTSFSASGGGGGWVQHGGMYWNYGSGGAGTGYGGNVRNVSAGGTSGTPGAYYADPARGYIQFTYEG